MTDTAPDGTPVDPVDTDAVRRQLERFAGSDAVTETDGRLTAEFGRSTYVTVGSDGQVDTGMPLHSFEGTAERLVFDHDAGELHVVADGVSYTFRSP